MKLITITSVFLLSLPSFSLNAQLSIKASAGMNYGVSYSNSNTEFIDGINGLPGAITGIRAELGDRFKIQTGLFYQMRNYKVNQSDLKVTEHAFEIPVGVRFKLGNGKLEGGVALINAFKDGGDVNFSSDLNRTYQMDGRTSLRWYTCDSWSLELAYQYENLKSIFSDIRPASLTNNSYLNLTLNYELWNCGH
ncbi:MAG: hypothetical protein R2879_20215 [Saprospiraceae bacterium]